MKIELTAKEKETLECFHQYERDGRVRDRIKCVLLRSEGWSIGKIAQALRLHNDTVSRHVIEYLETGKLDPNYRGSSEKFSEEQRQELIAHLEERLYATASEVIRYVKERYGIEYTVAGMTDFLKRHGFSYKQTTGQPAKIEGKKQQAFVKHYQKLKAKTPANEPILFIDAVHPTMASKLSRGWIRKGTKHVVPTTASRTRMNIVGMIELSTMKVMTRDYETVNGESIISFLGEVKAAYPDAPRVHVVLDGSGYHRKGEVLSYARKHHIALHFLPPYSPNLNPIERLWKVMNEQVRNDYFFKSSREFRDRIKGFFQVSLPGMAESLRSRINDNFHILESAKSF